MNEWTQIIQTLYISPFIKPDSSSRIYSISSNLLLKAIKIARVKHAYLKNSAGYRAKVSSRPHSPMG